MTPIATPLADARRSRATFLRDGSQVRVRPVRPSDAFELQRMLEGLSSESLHSRFFGRPNLERTAARLAEGSRGGDFAVVAESLDESSIVGHAGAFRLGAGRAEGAFLVADAWQGRGLGPILLSNLLDAARERGIVTLVAEVLPSNRAMLAVFRGCGHPMHVSPGLDVLPVRIDIAPLDAEKAFAA